MPDYFSALGVGSLFENSIRLFIKMKLSLLLFLFVGTAASCFSQSKSLKFSDESQLLLSKNVAPQKDFTEPEESPAKK